MSNLCSECGSSYLKIQPNQKYCSLKCRHKAQGDRYRKKYPEKIRKHNRKYQLKLRADVFELYGNECLHCEQSNPIVLSLDHKIPVGNKRLLTYPLYAKILKHKDDKEYLSHFQLLCRNCNWIKLINNKERENLKNGSLRPEPSMMDIYVSPHTLDDWIEEV